MHIFEKTSSKPFQPCIDEDLRNDRAITDKLIVRVNNFLSSDNIDPSTITENKNIQKPYNLQSYKTIKKIIKTHRNIVVVLDHINYTGLDFEPARIVYFLKSSNHICQAVHERLHEIYSSNHRIQQIKLLLVSESAYKALIRVIKVEKVDKNRIDAMVKSLNAEEAASGIQQNRYCTIM